MELYHIHRDNEYNDMFKVGNTLTFGNEPNNMRRESLERSACIPNGITEFNGKKVEKMERLFDLLDYEKISNMSYSKQIYLLDRIKEYVYNSSLDIREDVLEYIRLKYYSERPSRFSCIYLTDEKSIETWKQLLNTNGNNDYYIYRVNAEGNIFSTSNGLLPYPHVSKDTMEYQAHNYWNPAPLDIKGDDKEILCDGDIKILEKVEVIKNRVK